MFVGNSAIYLGGLFTQVGGSARTYAAAVNTSGALLSWAPTLSGNEVRSISASASNVFLGGDFSTVNGAPRSGFATVAP
jgi:hypothetical protein